MTKLDYYFLSILKATTNDSSCDIKLPQADINSVELFELAKSQKVVPFLTDYYHRYNPNLNILPVMKDYTKQQMLKYYQLEAFTCRIYDILHENDIDFILIKGLTLSNVYPKCDYRISSDVDIYIQDLDTFKKACELFTQAGFATEKEMDPDQKCDHHVCFYETSTANTFIVEVHYHITGKVGYDKANQVIEEVFETKLSTSSMTICDREFTILEPSSYVLYLILHMLKHYLSKGLNIKLLLDLLYFGQAKASEIDYQKISDWCKRSGIYTFYRTVYTCLVNYLDYNWDGDLVESSQASALMDKILHYSDSNNQAQLNRSRVYEKVNIISLFREGHYQMRANYPKASRCFILWPILWFVTLIVFIRNNKTVRGSSTRQVIKQFKKQNDQTNDILLFEMDES